MHISLKTPKEHKEHFFSYWLGPKNRATGVKVVCYDLNQYSGKEVNRLVYLHCIFQHWIYSPSIYLIFHLLWEHIYMQFPWQTHGGAVVLHNMLIIFFLKDCFQAQDSTKQWETPQMIHVHTTSSYWVTVNDLRSQDFFLFATKYEEEGIKPFVSHSKIDFHTLKAHQYLSNIETEWKKKKQKHIQQWDFSLLKVKQSSVTCSALEICFSQWWSGQEASLHQTIKEGFIDSVVQVFKLTHWLFQQTKVTKCLRNGFFSIQGWKHRKRLEVGG